MKHHRFLLFLFFIICLTSLAFAVSCGGGDDDDDNDDNDDDDTGDDDDNDDDNDDAGDDDNDTADNSYDAVKTAGEIGFIDFEDGTDGHAVASTIQGLEFINTEGYDWIYGDWRTGNYNGPYPSGSYYSHGDFFAWLGQQQGAGIITFASAYATYFQIAYSSNSIVYLEAYDIEGNLLAEDSGEANLETGEMGVLRVEMPGMAYVMVHDSGNMWLVDDLETDARPY